MSIFAAASARAGACPRGRAVLWLLVFVAGQITALAQARAGTAAADADEAAALAAALAEEAQGTPAAPLSPQDPTGLYRAAPAAVGPGPRGGLQSMNPDLSVLLDTVAAGYSQDPENLGEHDPAGSGLTLQQLELHFSSTVDPFLRLDANLVFMPHGVELEEAFATTLSLPGRLQLRAGQFLHRFGHTNATHPHAWNFLDQLLVLGKFYGSDGGRGIGLEVSYLLPLFWYAEGLLSVQQAFGNCCSRSMTSRAPAPQDLIYTGAIKQFFAFNDDWGLLLGVSAQTGDWQRGGRTVIAGTDWRLRYRPVGQDRRRAVTLQLEALWRRRAAGGQVLTDGGGFAELLWTLGPRWEVATRAEGVSGIGAPAAGADAPAVPAAAPEPTGLGADPLDPNWVALRQRYAVSTTFWPTHFSRVRLQGTYGRLPWRPAGERNIWGLLLGLEVLIGAHGAHSY